LRVALAEHLSYPLIGYASGTQPCGISGTKIIRSESRESLPVEESCRVFPNG
jgi:hypothetical protein